MAELRMWKAINSAIDEEMKRDERVFTFGEDVARMGGTFGITKGLLDKYGEKRVFDFPISETALVGCAAGAAIAGYRPILEIMFADFLFICMDEISSIAAPWRYIHGPEFSVPLVIRAPMGGGFSAGYVHSQCPVSHFLHVPGVKIVVPSSPADAKGLLKTAVRDDNLVIFFEHKGMYALKGEVPEGDFTIPFGVAEVKREGKNVTVVAISSMVPQALKVADEMEKEGISIEVVDPRTLEPLDIDTIIKSVKKTGRVVLAEEAYMKGGVMAELGMRIVECAHTDLKAPIRRVGAPLVPIPYHPKIEKAVLPSAEHIYKAVMEVIQ